MACYTTRTYEERRTIQRLCPHRCYYCFAPNVLHREREVFHSCVEPRKDIVAELRRQLEREKITGKLIHLCFTCDPYSTGYDTTTTREVIKALKEHGNHVQILTKGDGSRDFDAAAIVSAPPEIESHTRQAKPVDSLLLRSITIMPPCYGNVK